MIRRILFSIMRLAIAALLVFFLMALLPFLIHLFSGTESDNKMISTSRIRPVQIVKENPPEQKVKLKLRSTHFQHRTGSARKEKLFTFTPDLSVGTNGGASVEQVDLETLLFEENEIDVPPKVRFLKPLRYPERARDAGIEGVVRMIILVGREGRVENVLFEELPDILFKRSIESQVKRWRFEPGTKDGVPVRVKVRQSVEFLLD